jgi:WD40 repeat protein
MSRSRAGSGLVAAVVLLLLAGCAGRPRQLAEASVPGGSEVRWALHDSLLVVALRGWGVSLVESANGHPREAWRLAGVPSVPAHGLATSATDETLAVATADSMRLFATRGLRPLFAWPGNAITLALSNDGSRIFWSDGAYGGLVDVPSGVAPWVGLLHARRGAIQWCTPLQEFLVPFGRQIMFAHSDLMPGSTLGPFMEGLPRRLALSPAGMTLAVAESTTHVSIWDLRSRHMRWRLAVNGSARLDNLALSQDAQLLATSLGGRARVLWAYSGRAVADWSPHGGAQVEDLAFAADGRRLATVGADGSVRTWAMPAAPRGRN